VAILGSVFALATVMFSLLDSRKKAARLAVGI
jgi:hypothetical protein